MGFTLNQHEQEKQIKRLQQKEDHDTTDYESLENLPEINGVELKGNKSLSDLGIQGDSLEAACGERLTLGPTVEGLALLTKAYGMSVQDGTPTPSSPADIESAKADFISTDGENTQNVTTNLTLRAIEVTSSDAYNLVRDNKYYIADTLDYSDDNGFVVTRRIGIEQASNLTWNGIVVNGYTGVSSTGLNSEIATTTQNPILTKYFQPTHVIGEGSVPDNAIAKFNNININTTVVSGATTNAERKTMWDTWLSTHDFDLYYILITPTTETITTAQALALLGLKTYDESTTISSQAEPSCTVAVEYAKERLGAVALSAYNKAVADGLSIAAIKSHILPDAPSTDGSYNLKVTVTSGESAYSWEAVTP